MDIAAIAKRILSILHPEKLATQFRKLPGTVKMDAVSASHSGLAELEHLAPLDVARRHSLRTEAELTGRAVVPDPMPLSQMHPLDLARQHQLRVEAELTGKAVVPDPIPLSQMDPLDIARQHQLRVEAELTGKPFVPDSKPRSQMSPLEFAQQYSLRVEEELAASRNLSPPAMPADGIRSAGPAIARSEKLVGG